MKRSESYAQRVMSGPSFIVASRPICSTRRYVRAVKKSGPVHLKTAQMMKDEELRSLLRKRGYRILELSYIGYTDKKRDELCREIMSELGKIVFAPSLLFDMTTECLLLDELKSPKRECVIEHHWHSHLISDRGSLSPR